MHLFSADATIFLKKFQTVFLRTKSLKKLASKVAQKNTNPFFFLTAWAAQTAEFMFQNVAYRPTVYRTGGMCYYHFGNEVCNGAIFIKPQCSRMNRYRNTAILLPRTFSHS